MNYFENPVAECNLLKIGCYKSNLPNIKDVNVIYPKKKMRRKLEKRWLMWHNKKLAKLIKNHQLLYIGYTLFLLYFTYLYKGKTFQHHITPLSRESTMVVANKLQWVVGMNSGLDYPKDPNKFISIFHLYHELVFENFCFTLPCHSQLTK